MIRRPPRSTLFPTRRSSDLPTARKPLASRTRVRVHLGTAEVLARAVQTPAIGPGQRGMARSEEHTSELQSRLHLVCRLLLEKKNEQNVPQHMRHAATNDASS